PSCLLWWNGCITRHAHHPAANLWTRAPASARDQARPRTAVISTRRARPITRGRFERRRVCRAAFDHQALDRSCDCAPIHLRATCHTARSPTGRGAPSRVRRRARTPTPPMSLSPSRRSSFLRPSPASLYFLLAAVAVLCYVLVAYVQNGTFGFPLDDAWIHQVYARNLGTHLEFSFFPGQPSAGSTSPLWAILLAVGYV